MTKKLQQIFGKTADVLRKYPMVLVMGFLAAVSLICFAEKDFDRFSENFVFVKITLVCCIGIPLMFGLKMLSERIGKEILLQLFGVAFLAFFYSLLPERKQDFTENYAFLVLPVIIMVHLFVSFAPFLSKNRELNFWQYNKNLFINFFLTGVFTGVLTGGVELAILAIDKLFDFNFNDRLYAETFYFFAIFGSCLIFLLFNEKGLSYLEKDGNHPLILKFFTQYVLIPLLLIYVVILYFYSAKILINWELPRGWVSYLVLAYSVVGILALLLVYPLKLDAAKSWVKVFSKIFYYTLLPLLVLLFTAIFTRILEYGYTEPRYFVLLLALWLTSVVLYFILIKKSTIKFIPVSLFFFGLFALIFPYLNTFSVAKRSQKNELSKILVKNNLLENGKINFEKPVADTIVDEISNKFDFLAKRNERDFLKTFLPANQDKLISALEKKDFWLVQGATRNAFKNIQNSRTFSYVGQQIFAKNRVIETAGYEKIITFSPQEKLNTSIDGQTLTTDLQNDQHFYISLENKTKTTATYDLMPFIKELINSNQSKTGRLEVDDISKEFELHNYRFKAFIRSVDYFKTGNDTYITPFETTLLISKKP